MNLAVPKLAHRYAKFSQRSNSKPFVNSLWIAAHESAEFGDGQPMRTPVMDGNTAGRRCVIIGFRERWSIDWHLHFFPLLIFAKA